MVICFLFSLRAVVFMEPVILELVMYSNCVLTIVALLQARALISRLTEEKNNAIQLNSKLRQELVRIYKIYLVDNFYFSIWIISIPLFFPDWRMISIKYEI